MSGSLRLLARSAIINCLSKPHISATRATTTVLRTTVSLNTSRAPYKRYLHDAAPAQAESGSASDIKVASPQELDSERRHPRFGVAAADYPRIVHINVPMKTTEADVKALLARADIHDAEVIMFYDPETGLSDRSCLLKLAKDMPATTAVSKLSRFTLFGADIAPITSADRKFSASYQPSLLHGWKASTSSDIKSRVVRPLLTESPKLLTDLTAERWVQFENLPALDPQRKRALFEVLSQFYKQYHNFDVICMSTGRNSQYPNWNLKVLFRTKGGARAARRAHVAAKTFMGRESCAKVSKGGANHHKVLVEYRATLPEDLSEDEIAALLNQKYRELLVAQKSKLQRSEHPTPESAVGLKDDGKTAK